jgi:hypothetical protein
MTDKVGIKESLNIPVPEAPQTIKQNWIPFLTFFFRRILLIYQQVLRQLPNMLAPLLY